MAAEEIFFEQIRSAGCLSYLLGCAQEKVCVVIDPEIDKADDYVGLGEFFKAKLLYAIDTHTHADHNSACKIMRERYGINVIMHRATDAPYICASTTATKSNSASKRSRSSTLLAILRTLCVCSSKIEFLPVIPS